MRNFILGALLLCAGCTASTSQLRHGERAATSMVSDPAALAPGQARSGASSTAPVSYGANLDRRAVADSQDPIPIVPAPMPSGAGGDSGNPSPGNNPVATGKR